MFYTDDRQGRPAKQDSASVYVCAYTCGGGEKRGWRRGKVRGDRRRNRGSESERVPLQLCPGVPPATQLQLQIKQNRVAAGAAPRH